MNGAAMIAALAILTLLCESAAARGGGLGTYTCIDRAGSLASDGSACRNWANPYESAARAAERRNAAWLKRFPDEAAYEAERRAVLEPTGNLVRPAGISNLQPLPSGGDACDERATAVSRFETLLRPATVRPLKGRILRIASNRDLA